MSLDVGTRLAFDRTRLAYDRTMMAWVRTATSMITFGFSVYKFFQIERDLTGSSARLIGPREFALMMVSLGLVALVMATLEYRANIKSLQSEFPEIVRSRTTMLVAVFVTILGIFALIAVLFRQ